MQSRKTRRSAVIAAGALVSLGAVAMFVGSPYDRQILGSVEDEDAFFAAVMIFSDLGSNIIEFDRVGDDTTFAVNQTALPLFFAKPRDFANIETLTKFEAAHFVFAGMDASGNGALSQVRRQTDGSFSETDTLTVPTSDFVGVAYSRGKSRLYLLDHVQGQITYAPYTVASANLPTSWSVLVDSQTVPQLANMSDYKMAVLLDNDGSEPILSLRPEGIGGAGKESILVTDGNAGVTYQILEDTTRYPAISDQKLTIGMTVVNVVAEPATMVDIVSWFDGSVIGSGITDASGHAQINLTQSLQLGQIYGASLPGQGLGPPFMAPYKNFGFSEDISPTLHIGDLGDGIAIRAETPNELFGFPLSITVDADPGILSWTAYLVIGMQQDIVPWVSGQSALLGPSIFPTTAHVDLTIRPDGWSSVPIPIPDDPMLIGVEFCAQWWILDGSSFRLSNIACVMIRDGNASGPTAASFGGGQRFSTSSKVEKRTNADARKALATWLWGAGTKRLGSGERDVLLKALSRSRRR